MPITLDGREITDDELDKISYRFWRSFWDNGGVYRLCVPEGMAERFKEEDTAND